MEAMAPLGTSYSFTIAEEFLLKSHLIIKQNDWYVAYIHLPVRRAAKLLHFVNTETEAYHSSVCSWHK